MGSVYGRLGFNFDTTLFDGADTLSSGVLKFLDGTSSGLSQWQIDDLANNTVSGYLVNPHNDSLGIISVFVTGIATMANTQYYIYDNPALANNMLLAATSAQTSLSNFAIHTNNLSGVTRSANTMVYPDLNSALSIGRLVLNITNESDAVQNNTPILGNFTSLYIGNTISPYITITSNDYITLTNSFGGANGNTSNISTASMNVIISDLNNLQSELDTRKNADISFYLNSLEIVQQYQYVSQFSSLGETQNSLIKLIGTDKLKTDLGTI